MNPEAILALLSDLYQTVAAANARIVELETALAELQRAAS